MNRTLHRLRRLKLWQATLLIAVLVGAAIGIYFVCDRAGGGSASEAGVGDGTRLATVQYGNLTSEISASGSLAYGTTERLSFDSAGEVQAIYVEKDDVVSEGELVAKLESTDTLILSLEEDVARAKVNLKNAEEDMEDLLEPYDEDEIADAEEAVKRAEEALANTQAQAEFDVADAEYALEKAQDERLDAVNEYLAGLVDLEEMQQAWNDAEEAELRLEIARQKAENAVYDAERALEEAEERLEDMLEEPDPLDVDLKERQIATARGGLDDAIEELEKAMEGYPLLAPFDGVIVVVNDDVEPGDDVSANTVIVEIADISVIEMSAVIDEIDVRLLDEGRKATVTLDAYPDIELSGEVASISAFAEVRSGVVQYPVTISLTVPSELKLRENMSATATIEAQLASNALLIPNDAILGTTDNPRVVVMVDGQPRITPVTLGATDYSRTEVIDGLGEGDVVVMQVSLTNTRSQEGTFPTPQQGFRPPEGFIIRQGGGGFPR